MTFLVVLATGVLVLLVLGVVALGFVVFYLGES
jgi:hypothetical protein